jgi:hypothetical protein
MAAMENLLKKSLVLIVNEGMDEDGKEILKRYSYSNIRTDVTADSVYDAAQAIGELYSGTVNEINTVDTNYIDQR